MKPVLEIRTSPILDALEIRAHEGDDGPRRLSGYGIPFDQWSDDLGGFKERILRGAFLSSIENDDIRAIYNHDSNFVIGRKSAGTLRLHEDERGVFYEADIPDTQWARDMTVSVERRDVTGNSFGFTMLADHWEERDGMLWRTVKEGQLRELGPQVFPAYPQSDVQVRSMEDVLRCGVACMKSQHPGQNPDLLARELELDRRLRARGRKASSAQGPPSPSFPR